MCTDIRREKELKRNREVENKEDNHCNTKQKKANMGKVEVLSGERSRNKQKWREKQGLKDGQGDGAREWASPQFTGFLSCSQLIIPAKGIKDEMNSDLGSVWADWRTFVNVCVCVFVRVIACFCRTCSVLCLYAVKLGFFYRFVLLLGKYR